MARDEQALRTAVEQSAAVLTSAGLPKMPARVLMALMVSDDGALTAAELAGQLEASPAAVSGAVRYLQSIGILRRVAQSGSRRDRYELPDDPWYTAAASESPVYGALASLADKAVDALADPASPVAHRVREMARFYRFLAARLPELMAEWARIRELD
ncbi:MarR family transcriptional regulator [Paeniglutamicibacter antarcticus]|uniref:MarR family transcriptional regulator n=1 Tax=Arthrobacter terrae TaxID=2935737 RepID=A0A931CJX6_9MICC|nr:MarR family transcriptional regulator [Arthrobacter terrae]MBG0737835.1 MarR family transcriptional regulator [Arthrobacter terrae]